MLINEKEKIQFWSTSSDDRKLRRVKRKSFKIPTYIGLFFSKNGCLSLCQIGKLIETRFLFN